MNSSIEAAARSIVTRISLIPAAICAVTFAPPALAASVDMTTMPIFYNDGTGTQGIPPGWTVDASADRIEVHKGTEPSPGYGAFFSYPGLLTGDFTYTVKVSNPLIAGKDGWTADGSATVSLFPAGTTYQGSAIEPGRFVSVIFAPAAINMQDEQGNFWGNYATTPSGDGSNPIDIRVTRIGDVMDFDYSFDGATFTNLYQATGVAGLAAGPSLGVGNGYGSALPADVTFSDLTVTTLENARWSEKGGALDAAVSLPDLPLTGIDGAIGPDSLEQYYAFHWDGGVFSASAGMSDADPADQFLLRLIGGDADWSSVLGVDNGFAGSIGGYLAAGDYRIGISGDVAMDPDFHIDFATPLGQSAAPEPASWAMLLLGFGMVGWRRRGRGARAMPIVS
jgi:hypothetical protein